MKSWSFHELINYHSNILEEAAAPSKAADISVHIASCPALLSLLPCIWPVKLYRLMAKNSLFCSSWCFYSQSKITLVYLQSERMRVCFPITFLSLLLEITGASHMHYISYSLSLWETASWFFASVLFSAIKLNPNVLNQKPTLPYCAKSVISINFSQLHN